MTLVTDSITYNVRERGRKHRGVERNFDTAALAKMINGPDVQERVKHGDMLGYFGHWPRVKFGMQPQEGVILDGKAVVLPVALRTVELHADADGTITHRAEFLDSEAGQVAEGYYKCKVGGFSSAIDAVPRTTPAIPRGFYGFDYVYEPNYTTNRGHKIVLDSMPELAALMDSVLEQAAIEQSEMAMIFDSLHGQHMDALEALERTSRENEELLDMVVKLTGKSRQQVLDSATLEHIAPDLILPADPSKWTQFRDAALQPLAELPKARAPETADTRYASNRFGVQL
jgi:hypothetical protein